MLRGPLRSLLPTRQYSCMSQSSKIVIRQLQPRDEDQCRVLFERGMREVWEVVYPQTDGISGYIQNAYKDDLKDITAFYVKPSQGSNFWVAIEDSNPNKIIGMVALEYKNPEEGELRRMSVSSEIRRGGLGRSLIAELEKFAKKFEYKRVVLSTGGHMNIAQQFYAKIGYNLDKVVDYELPVELEPKFQVYYYSKEL